MRVKELNGYAEIPRSSPLDFLGKGRSLEANGRLEPGELDAFHAKVRRGYKASRVDGGLFVKRRNIEGRLLYSPPAELSVAYQDLVKMGRQTEWDYTNEMKAFFDSVLFDGEWELSRQGASDRVDTVTAEIVFPGYFRTGDETKVKRPELLRLVDAMYEPRRVSDGSWVTETYGYLNMQPTIRGEVPVIYVRKTWPEFDEGEVATFYHTIRGFSNPRDVGGASRDIHMLLDVGIPVGRDTLSARYHYIGENRKSRRETDVRKVLLSFKQFSHRPEYLSKPETRRDIHEPQVDIRGIKEIPIPENGIVVREIHRLLPDIDKHDNDG